MSRKSRRLRKERDRWQRRFYDEREKLNEKALEIKESERDKALDLARRSQDYRDEQANKLREQLGAERGTYATKEDVSSLQEKMHAEIQSGFQELKLTVAPFSTYMATQQGRSGGIGQGWKWIVGAIAVFGALVGIVSSLIVIFNLLMKR